MRLPRPLRQALRLRGAGALLRRWVAAFALLAVAGANAEAIEGVLRDGSVHHESSAVAAEHAIRGGEHGHEDGPLSDHPKHGAGHQHGTSADHCTHQHGTALPSSATLAARAHAEFGALPDVTGHPAWISTTLFHPPRA